MKDVAYEITGGSIDTDVEEIRENWWQEKNESKDGPGDLFQEIMELIDEVEKEDVGSDRPMPSVTSTNAVRLVSMSSLVNTTVYAYRMFLRDFDRFEKYGPNALRVLFLLLAYSHMQQRNNKFLPVKNDYRWVRFQTAFGQGPSKKSKI